ncbi:hypothetical protein L7F22_048811 [Adiantum nelumboides]|nr:hypothetical protein [Adiantum nelumboides]
MRVDAGKAGIVNAMELDASSKANVDGNVIDVGLYANANSIGVDAGKDGIVNAMEVNASSNATIDVNVNDGGTNVIIDVADDIEVIDGVHRNVELDKLEKATLSTSIIAAFGTYAIVVPMSVDAETDGIVNSMEVDASSNATIDGNVNDGGTYAIIDVAKDIEVVGTNAIIGNRKDMGEEDLIDRGARIGEAVLKSDVMAQDKAVCQIDVNGLAIDVQVVHDGVNVDCMNVIMMLLKLMLAQMVLLMAIHDGVLKNVELDKLKKVTLSTSTLVGLGANSIIDPMVVDVEINGNMNAMKVDASIDVVVDSIVNDASNVIAMKADASTDAAIGGIIERSFDSPINVAAAVVANATIRDIPCNDIEVSADGVSQSRDAMDTRHFSIAANPNEVNTIVFYDGTPHRGAFDNATNDNTSSSCKL